MLPNPQPPTADRPRRRAPRALVAILVAAGLVLSEASTALADEATPAQPVIVTQPQAVTVSEGEPLELSVGAENATGYRWQVVAGEEAPVDDAAWTDIDATANATAVAETLRIDAVAASDAGYYRAVVTGEADATVATDAVTVSVEPADTSDGTDSSDDTGDSGDATPPADGDDADGTDESGDDAGDTDDAEQTAPVETEVTVPTVVTQPESGSVYAGDAASFTVEVAGIPSGVPWVAATVQYKRSATRWGTQVEPVVLTPDGGAVSYTFEVPETTLSMDGRELRVYFNWGGDEGVEQGELYSESSTLTVTEKPAAPEFTTQPQNVVVDDGASASFTVAATGTPEPSLAWERKARGGEWETIEGETSSTLTLASVTFSDDYGAQYRAVATNSEGTTYSDAATLTVRPTVPTFVTQPRDVAAYVGDSVTFTVEIAVPSGTVSRSVAANYSTNGTRWRLQEASTSVAAVDGVVSYSFTVSDVTTSLSGRQYRVVTGDYVSEIATLTVTEKPLSAPVFTTSPSSTELYEGRTAVFAATADGNPEPVLTWERLSPEDGAEWEPVAGATGGTLTLEGVTLAQSGTQYRAVATSSEGTTYSDPATLIVKETDAVAGAPVIEEQPQDVSTTTAVPDVGFTTTLAAGSTATSARWEYSTDGGETWTAFDDAGTLTTLDDGRVRASFGDAIDYDHYTWEELDAFFVDGALYRAVLANEEGETASEAATLHVTKNGRVRITSEGPYYRGQTVTVEGEYFDGAYGKARLGLSYDGQTLNWIDFANDATLVSVTSDGTFTTSFAIPVLTDVTSSPKLVPLTGLHILADDSAVSRPLTALARTTSFDLEDRSGEFSAPTITAQPKDVAGQYDPYTTVTTSVGFTGGAGTTVYWVFQQNTAQVGTAQQLSASDHVTGDGTDTLTIRLSEARQIGAHWYAIVANDAGWVKSDSLTSVLSSAPEVTTDLETALVVGTGESATLQAAASAAPDAEVAWQRSTDGGTTWQDVSDGVSTTSLWWVTSSDLALETLSAADTGTQFKAVFANDLGSVETTVLTLTVSDSATPPSILTAPRSQTIESGEPVTFTASATGVPAPTLRWQRSTDDGATWSDLRGATSGSYTVDKVSEDMSGWRYRAVFTNAAAPEGVATASAVLTVTERENIREYCGTSYGPSGYSGDEFCFRGPEKVVYGEDIVIEGVGGYLATDDKTGSVVNFFLDALYSGDPNTIYSTQTFTNPATGKTITDKRTNAVVQANADGTWKATIAWPTSKNVTPNSDGSGGYDAQALAELFAAGTTHSIRMLTGSLLTSPADRQRGASLMFTVVNSLDDEVEVTEPIYEHFTYASEADGDDAVAWIPTNVDSGGSFKLTGTGWLTKDGQWGSSVSVRLQDETGAYYQHAGTEADPYPVEDDPTVWQVIQAPEDGDVDVSVTVPPGATAGDYLAVELTTTDDGTELGDVERHWVSEALSIDETPYIPELGEDATCTAGAAEYSYELDPGRTNAAANVGGSIRLTGENWCNLVGGGSLVAVKINAGGYSHKSTDVAAYYDANVGKETGTCKATICSTNKTIWYVIEADENGSFDVDIPLPDRTDSVPTFGEGSYTLQLLTRTISADPYYAGSRPDPSRSIQTREFTVVAEGKSLDNVTPGKPSAEPDPLHITQDLTDKAKGGVTVAQKSTSWVVTVPNAKKGDWVYVNVYDGSSPRFPFGQQWYQVNAKHQVTIPLAGASIPTGTNKVSVQDRNGGLLGWTWVTVAAKDGGGTASGSGSGGTRTITSGSGVRYAASATTTGEPKPGTTPDQPVPSYTELDEGNVGDVTAVEEDGNLVITIPGVEGGHWVYLYLYTEDGRVIPVDWVQVGTDHTITIEIASLPDGVHKLALLDEDGQLVGWVTAKGENALTGDAADDFAAGEDAAGAAGGGLTVAQGAADPTWTLVLIGLALLVLAGSAAGVIMLRGPVRPPTAAA